MRTAKEILSKLKELKSQIPETEFKIQDLGRGSPDAIVIKLNEDGKIDLFQGRSSIQLNAYMAELIGQKFSTLFPPQSVIPPTFNKKEKKVGLTNPDQSTS